MSTVTTMVAETFDIIRENNPDLGNLPLTIEWAQPAGDQDDRPGTREFDLAILPEHDVDTIRIHSTGDIRNSGPTARPSITWALRGISAGCYAVQRETNFRAALKPATQAVMFHTAGFEQEVELFEYTLSQITSRPVSCEQIWFESHGHRKVAHSNHAQVPFWMDTTAVDGIENMDPVQLHMACAMATIPEINFADLSENDKSILNNKVMNILGILTMRYTEEELNVVFTAATAMGKNRRIAIERTSRLPSAFLDSGKRVLVPTVGAWGLNEAQRRVYSPKFPVVTIHPSYSPEFERSRDLADRAEREKRNLPTFLQPKQ